MFGAQVVSLLGSGVTTVALALFAYQLVGGQSAAAIVGNALMLRIAAFLLFSQLAGVLADRMNRKLILVGADLVRLGLLALFPFVSSVWHVYLLVFSINAVTAFFTPTFEAILPDVVGEAAYVDALAWSRVASEVETVAAPALAALLVSWMGVRWVFWFDAGTYGLSALLVAFAALPTLAVAGRRQEAVRRFFKDVTHGTRVILREAALRQALLLSFAEATGGSCAIVATVAYVRILLHRGDATAALAMGAVGAGSAITAIALGRVTARYEVGAKGAELHRRRHLWARSALLVAGLVLSLALLPGLLVPALGPFIALWLLNGSGQALVAIPSSALLAEHTFAEERGRVYAAHFALTHAFWLIAYPAVGHATSRWGPAVTFTSAGAACFVIVVAAYFSGRGTVRSHGHDRDQRP